MITYLEIGTAIHQRLEIELRKFPRSKKRRIKRKVYKRIMNSIKSDPQFSKWLS